MQQIRAAALPGRVDDDHIGPDALLCQGLGRLSRVAAEEPRILDAVLPGVLGGVFHCLPDNLHADYLLDLVGQAQSDGTGAAVEIQQDIVRGQLGKLPGNAVELLSAVVVDLIECHGGDVKPHATQGVGDMILSVDQPALFAEDHIGALPVDVEHDAGKFRELFGDAVDKLAAVWQFRAVENQAEHQFS